MRTIQKERGYFRGTHKGAEIEIERAGPFEDYEFYIRVRADNGDGGYMYDGYAPTEVTTMAAAKREAIRGACLNDLSAGPCEPAKTEKESDAVGRALKRWRAEREVTDDHH